MLTVKVEDLIPGQIVTAFGDVSATYVAQAEHPIWPTHRLVIWRMADGSWYHDALSAGQVVGDAAPSSADERLRNLRTALLGRP